MSNSAGDWCLIESDPGVFTELIRGFGVTGVQVEELWTLNPGLLKFDLEFIHGLIFLFKWIPDDKPSGSIVTDSRLDKIFFAKQVINNACATQAIISVLLNTHHEDVQLGETLTSFRDFSASFDPTMKGLALSNCKRIKDVHNSFARQQIFGFDSRAPSKEDDVYHFIAYIPFEGKLYELDGLKDGPIDLGPIEEGTSWVDVAKPAIMKRIEKYSKDEIHFNLMAIISDRRLMYEKKIAEIESKLADAMDPDSMQAQIAEYRSLIEAEEAKMKRYRIENIRRKHNYLPLIVDILKTLAQEGKLMDLIVKETKAKTSRKVK